MKLWLFTFTQEDRVLSHARIACDDPAGACAIMGNIVGRPLIYTRNRHPEPGTIMQFMGQEELNAPCVRSLLDGEGRELMT